MESDEEDDFGWEELCSICFSHAYGGKMVLHQTKLQLRRGHCYALLGQNGAGKTTPWLPSIRESYSIPFQIHYFVMTGRKGNQMYGVCLTIHEQFSVTVKSSSMEEPKLIEMYIPKCICILSSYPYLVAFREYLTQLDRLTRKGDMPIPVERYITNFCAQIPAPPPGSFEVQTQINDSLVAVRTGTSMRKQSRWDAVLEAFMGVYVDLLCPYRKCLIFPSKDNNDNQMDGAESSGSGSYGGAPFMENICTDIIHYEQRAMWGSHRHPVHYCGKMSRFVKKQPQAKHYFELAWRWMDAMEMTMDGWMDGWMQWKWQ